MSGMSEMYMDRERRKKGTDTRIVNTPVAACTHAFLKLVAGKRRVAIGVILDEWAAMEAAKQKPAAPHGS
jgi:hypothetical protein